MNMCKNFIAFDIGASNGRCVIGKFDGEILSLDILNRFDNGYIRVGDHLHWDILGLFEKVKQSLRKITHEIEGEIASIGVDTWGVDFGLLDAKGELIGNPYCYRDPHTTGMMEKAFELVPKKEIFEITGIQFMTVNTLYQLMAMVHAGSPALEIARTFLMIPDLLSYWMTGVKACEYTNASITQLLDATTKEWATSFIERMGIPSNIFPEILCSGQIMGNLIPTVCDETGMTPTPVIAVGTHDTAAAVAAVPANVKNFAYLSSGTWGLLGAEVSNPVLSDKVFVYNFGNEGGVYNTIRLLRNVVNMWFVQECLRCWELEGKKYAWDEIHQLVDQATPFQAYFDPDDPKFLLPDHMPHAIQEYCANSGQNLPHSDGEILRVCFESLAMKYRYNLEKLADILGKEPSVFHIVGGASRNQLLNQFTAEVINRPLIAGPYEATALGNLIVQMIATGELANLQEGRQMLRASFPPEVFIPQDSGLWEGEYARYLENTGLK